MKCHPNGDRTLLSGAKSVKQKNHTITITVPPAAFLLLQAVALNESNQTVEEWCQGAIAEAVRPVFAGLADEDSRQLFDWFTPEKEEA